MGRPMKTLEFITNPAYFNGALMLLQLLAAMRWALARNWNQALYWLFATGIVWTVTKGLK